MDTVQYHHQAGRMEAVSPLDLSLRKSVLEEMSRNPTRLWAKGAVQVAKTLKEVKMEHIKSPTGGHSGLLDETGLHKDQACLPLRKRRFPQSPKEEKPIVKRIDECEWTRQCYNSYVAMPVLPTPGYYQGSPPAYVSSTIYSAPAIMTPRPLRLVPATLNTEIDLHADIIAATRADEDGDTALHIAVVHENILAVQRVIALLNHGRINLDILNNLRQTPLHLAVITNQPDIVGLLLEHGSSPSIQDRNGQTCVHLACEYGSIACLEVLMRADTKDLEATNYEGMTALHIAVSTERRDLTLCLLKHGVDVNAVDIKSGQSPLIQAVESNQEDMVSLLIQNGAKVNQLTYAGNTALHVASGRGLAEITRLLLKSGADGSIKNCHNDTALTVARDKKIADILRGKSSSPRAQNERFKGESREHTITPPQHRIITSSPTSISPPP
ncbi:B-cell lymphoma 3 protein [Lithobates pipiens]